MVLGVSSYAQVGIGTTTPNANAILDITCTDKGLLPPRMTTSEKTTLGSSLGATEKGMLVFDTDLNGLYLWSGTAWRYVQDTASVDKSKAFLYLTGASSPIVTGNDNTYGEQISGPVALEADFTNKFGAGIGQTVLLSTATTTIKTKVDVSLSYHRTTNTNVDSEFTFQLITEDLSYNKSIVNGSTFQSKKSALVSGLSEEITTVSFSAMASIDALNGVEVRAIGDGTTIVVDNFSIIIVEVE